MTGRALEYGNQTEGLDAKETIRERERERERQRAIYIYMAPFVQSRVTSPGHIAVESAVNIAGHDDGLVVILTVISDPEPLVLGSADFNANRF